MQEKRLLGNEGQGNDERVDHDVSVQQVRGVMSDSLEESYVAWWESKQTRLHAV